MKSLLNLLQMDFIPRSVDAALLVLRLWLGGCLVVLHGWDKLRNYPDMLAKFGDPIGIGPAPSLWLTIFAEVVCAVLIVIGLLRGLLRSPVLF